MHYQNSCDKDNLCCLGPFISYQCHHICTWSISTFNFGKLVKRTIQDSIICFPRYNRHIVKIYRMPTMCPTYSKFSPSLLNGIQPLTTFMGPCRDRIWYTIFSSYWLAPHQWCLHWYGCHSEHSMYKETPTLNPRPHV